MWSAGLLRCIPANVLAAFISCSPLEGKTEQNQPAFGTEAGLVLILCPHHLILLVQNPHISFPVEFLLPFSR